MRILVVTNLYPPAVIGGYEIGCERLVTGLRARGHEVWVLASDWHRDGSPMPPPRDDVFRTLPISLERPPILPRAVLEYRSQRAARQVLRRFRPDVTYAFNMRFISRSSLFLAQDLGPVVYYVSDSWLAGDLLEDGWSGTWQWAMGTSKARLRTAARVLSRLIPDRLLRTDFADLRLEHVQFTSEAFRLAALESGRDIARPEVVHWGVDLEKFSERAPVQDMTTFLYVGQLIAHKGVRTAVEAFIELVRRCPDRSLRLTLVGGTTKPEYLRDLRQLVDEAEVTDQVEFYGEVDAEEVPDLYRRHDALIFPSEWDEPFSLVLVEAMAAGLPIVSTVTGGTGEIVRPDHNALVFDAGDSSSCSDQLERLFDLDLARRLQVNARQTAERFSLTSMVDAVEATLRAAVLEHESR